ncbi:growth/differentiation factor 6-A-like [Saccostrea echinata]|uniref:growth/differentiation factor 6-A-like n=1 Tax=Saccostrea echinata TaxID=191078 RepID=UPI002A824845|nr:growth/differentiation factor 6-A-like [Saccostrea echinata]
MSLQYYSSTFLLVLCTIHVLKFGVVFSEEEFDTSTPSMKDVPRSAWTLVDKLKEAVERINGAVDYDISFHPLDFIDGEYRFDLNGVLSDPYVTGLDLTWASSSEQTCEMVLAGNAVKLHGKVSYGYVFFDLDNLLAEGHSNKYIKAKVLPSHICHMKNPPEKSFLVVYRNETKENLFRELENLRLFRPKRQAGNINSDNQSIREARNLDNPLRENEASPGGTETNQKTRGCRLVPWTVDFVQLHWDRYILSPKSFQANACQGDCVQTGQDCTHSFFDKKPTNYYLLRILYRVGLNKTVPNNPSCKPAKYGSQAIMFLGDGSLVIRNVAKMRVLECKCDC